MSRLSLWQDGKHSNDYKFFDRRISEFFTIGGTSVHVYKYLGAENPNVTNDATQPNYPNLSAQNIQDILFLENRDRKYSQDIYRLRCLYNIQDLDFDLSQFGLMISSGTLFISFHTVDMVNAFGRKLMSGDVLELPHLKEFYSLDYSIPVALKRFYVVQDATRSAEGFTPTWWSHIWRVKCTPLVASQEYQEILNMIVKGDNGLPILVNGNVTTYSNITSSIIDYNDVNQAIVAQAEYEVPKSGYNTEALWAPLFTNGNINQPPLPPGSSPEQKFTGYLVGDSKPIDGYPVTTAISFPDNPEIGQYILRQDYFPQRLFRYNGSIWQYVDNNVRTPLTPGTGQTRRDTFVNNNSSFIDSIGNAEPVLQNLSNLLRPDKNGF